MFAQLIARGEYQTEILCLQYASSSLNDAASSDNHKAAVMGKYSEEQ